MRELDRRVAIEVMGEEKPPPPPEDALCRGMGVITDGTISPGRNWEAFCVYENGDIPEWYPVPFSTSLEHAQRALKKKLYELGGRVTFSFDEQGWVAWDARGSKGVPGPTLPITICTLVLNPKERE